MQRRVMALSSHPRKGAQHAVNGVLPLNIPGCSSCLRHPITFEEVGKR